MTSKSRKPFHFKQFDIYHDRCSMKVGTDGVLLGAWADVSAAKTILDIGTGTGLIAIILAQRTKSIATIDAIEIEQNAYNQAQENVSICPWTKQINVWHSAVQDFKSDIKYDLIVSNPPYFLSGTKSHLDGRNLARHTTTLSQHDLLASIKRWLAPGGKFSIILPTQEGVQFIEKAKEFDIYCNKLVSVRPKIDKPVERLLIELTSQQQTIEKSELVIQFEKRNHYTPEYIALTREFYTIMP